MRLQTRLALAILLIFSLSLLVVESLDYYGIQREVLNTKTQEARSLRNLIMATRHVYHRQFLDSGLPLADNTLGFLPAHALPRISEDFPNWDDTGLTFNNVSDRPRNPGNAADSHELEAMAFFRDNPVETERMSVYTDRDGKKIYHYATPIWVEAYCLTCHGKAAEAPSTIRARYDAGYDYREGELRGILSIKMPGPGVEGMVLRSLHLNLLDHLTGDLLIVVALSFLLHFLVIGRLRGLREAAVSVAEGRYQVRVPCGSRDELGEVASAFNHMAETIARREESLKASERRNWDISHQLQTLLDGIPDVIHLLAPDLTLVWGNKSSGDYFHVSPEEMKGEHCYALCHQTDKPCANCPALQCFSAGKSVEETIATPNGRIWGVKAFPLRDETGQVSHVIELASDITEKLRLREEASRSSQLAALGELAAGVAHEINNPNALILLNLPLLQDVFCDAAPILDDYFRSRPEAQLGGFGYERMRDEVPKVLEEVREGGRRIKRIVDDLKDFVRRERIDTRESFSLNEAVQAALRLAANPLRKSTDHLETHYGENIPPLHGSKQRIEQVVINLVLNACQALPERNRSIKVTTGYHAESNLAFLEVVDAGVGIAPENLARITEPFFTTKQDSGGTGLGLSVSLRIVREHGGTLVFESVPGEGTRAVLNIPVIGEG